MLQIQQPGKFQFLCFYEFSFLLFYPYQAADIPRLSSFWLQADRFLASVLRNNLKVNYEMPSLWHTFLPGKEFFPIDIRKPTQDWKAILCQSLPLRGLESGLKSFLYRLW